MKIGQTGSLGIQNSLNGNKTEAMKVLEKISSQKEIEMTDAASMEIAQALQSQIGVLGQGVNNANEGIGILAIADSTLSSLSKGASKLQELTTSMGNGALNSDQKAMIQKEADSVISTMNDSINQSTYNGKNVFDNMSFNVGEQNVNISLQAPALSSLSLDSNAIQSFVDTISSTRSSISGASKQLGSTVQTTMVGIANREAARSQIADVKMEEVISNFQNTNLKLTSSTLASVHNNNMLQKNIQSLLGA